MRPPSLTAVQCADSPHSPAHAPCSPPATSHYTTGRLRASDLCAPSRRLLHCGADFPAPTPPVREERSALRMAKKRSEPRSEEHTSELQSLAYLVCRLLLEKKKKTSALPVLRTL